MKKLFLRNFRTYSEIALEFHTRLIFFIGENGAGKTNLVESLSILSLLKSFRGNTEDEIIKWGENFFYISSVAEKDMNEHKVEYGYELQPRRRKKIQIDGKPLRRISDAYGFIPCVVLSPLDMKIVDGGHSERRDFIDNLIAYLDPRYTIHLNEYNRILKQRNASLKEENIPKNLLLVWDRMLMEKDNEIRISREKWIQEFNRIFQKDLHLLSGGRDLFLIQYFPNVKSSEEFQNRIRENFPKDLRLGYTTVGCHRDEILIGLEGKDIQEFGSQGQKRSIVISLKTSSFRLLKEKRQIQPVLIVDDVIRELDANRRKFFVDLIRECGQAFFTTTDLEGIEDYIGGLEEPRQVFRVEKGSVLQIT